MMKQLQKLGKALMLPVAALPICGILMGIGYLMCPATMQGGDVTGIIQIIGFFLAVFLFPNLLYLNELEQALTRLLPMFAFALAVSILLSIAVDKIRFFKK